MSLWRALVASRPRQLSVASHSQVIGLRWSSHWTRSINPLTRTLRDYLRDDMHRAALQHFYYFMDRERLPNEARFEAFIKSWILFARSGHLSDARDIYRRMETEGFVPPTEIRTSMSALLCLAANDLEGFAGVIERSFTRDDFDQRCLRHVIRNIAFQSHFPPKFYDDLVALYIEHRVGSEMEDATRALLAYIRSRRRREGGSAQGPSPQDEGSRGEETRDDIKTLLQMAAADSSLAPVIHSVIRRLNMTGQGPDRVFYNNILSVLVARRRYNEVFQLYGSMLTGDASILPDAHTFAYIIRAIASYSLPRSAHSRQHKKPQDAPSPRQIFRDMLQCHASFIGAGNMTGRSDAITGSVLNKALRLFVDVDDYAAAYVALGAYRTIHLPITLATYRAALGGIIARMQRELPQLTGEAAEMRRVWTYRFLGSPEDVPEEVDVRTLEAVLRLARRRNLKLHPISLASPEYIQNLIDEVSTAVAFRAHDPPKHLTHVRVPRGRWRGDSLEFDMPSAVAILGILEPPWDSWKPTPLRRLVRRALLATRARVFLPETKVVSMEIRQARAEMIPEALRSPRRIVPLGEAEQAAEVEAEEADDEDELEDQMEAEEETPRLVAAAAAG